MLSRLMTRKEQAVLVLFGTAIVLGAGVLFLTKNRAPDGVMHLDSTTATALEPTPQAPNAPPSATPPAVPESTPSPPAALVISVQGAVTRPGVYTVNEGDRVQDLLKQAGGALETANLTNINLAAKLVDGTTLIVPSWDGNDYWSYQAASNPPHYTIHRQSEATAAASVEAAAGPVAERSAAGSGSINLNTATQSQLESLPGIGPVFAQEIIRFREQAPFRTIDDVTQVRGIGPKRLEAIRPLITVE